MYTIYGMFIGFVLSYFFCRQNNIHIQTPHRGPSEGEVIIFLTVIFCGGIGFGYGASILMSGQHYLNKLTNVFK